ncbi:MAG TPA: nuclear transport factor 2 family protein [Acidobacteriaceae bacterium]|jgi:hypothetical protein|nr:nuclear transport factor 2 family protein [Acidobacteriaceae bacterium]
MRNRYLLCTALAVMGFSVSLLSLPANAQASRWAAADDPLAKSLIEQERKWAEAGCTHNGIEKTILAEDFHGTAPNGSLYDKKVAVASDPHPKTSEEACVMYDVKVHYFGDNIAILYGSESAVHVEADGHKDKVKLTWTDTWLKRNGKWQIIAVQDMPSEMK